MSPSAQLSENAGGSGRSAGSPSGAPASTQAVMVSISSWFSRRSFSHAPYCGSANQGGISPDTTLSLMARAQGRVSA